MVELDIPNLNKDVVARIESLPCARTVVIEDDTHLKVHASGEDACGDGLDAVRMGEGQIRSVHNVELTLEDMFLHLTGRGVREQVADKITAPARRPIFVK